MNAQIVRTLFLKDLRLYFRNRFFAYVTIVGMIIYVALYTLMPSTVDENPTLAVYAPGIPQIFINLLNSNDIQIAALESDEALRQAIIDNRYIVGIVLDPVTVSAIMLSREAAVTVYFASDTPPEISDAMRTVLRVVFNEISYSLNGNPLPVTFNEQVIGPDMTGNQIPSRDRLLPLLAVMMLVLEMMGLGSLIADEVEKGTLNALLITPVTVPGLFIAKSLLGITLAFVQASTLMALTGNLASEPLLILSTLLLGALVVTGLAFLIASFSRDFLGVMSWSILIIILMMLPSYGVVFPGVINNWTRVIPSYYMVDTIHRVVNFGASWGAVWGNLLVLLAMGIFFMGAGMLVMERKLR
jgi:ABC-2 type transport system permease protein